VPKKHTADHCQTVLDKGSSHKFRSTVNIANSISDLCEVARHKSIFILLQNRIVLTAIHDIYYTHMCHSEMGHIIYEMPKILCNTIRLRQSVNKHIWYIMQIIIIIVKFAVHLVLIDKRCITTSMQVNKICYNPRL